MRKCVVTNNHYNRNLSQQSSPVGADNANGRFFFFGWAEPIRLELFFTGSRVVWDFLLLTSFEASLFDFLIPFYKIFCSKVGFRPNRQIHLWLQQARQSQRQQALQMPTHYLRFQIAH